jgi:hypothetical protein
MKCWSFANLDGVFTGVIFSGPEYLLVSNTPPGNIAVPGMHDHRRHRAIFNQDGTVDVVRVQPARPADDEWHTWSWNDAADDWVSSPTDAAVARNVRAERDRRISASDWVVIRAIDKGEPIPDAWSEYRQALRDVTNQPGFPIDITWPQQP